MSIRPAPDPSSAGHDGADSGPKPPDASGEPQKQPGNEAGPPRRLGAGTLIALLILGIVAWFVVRNMVSAAHMQDCVSSGRRNCAPVDDPAPR